MFDFTNEYSYYYVTIILSICAVISNIFVGIYFSFIGCLVDIKFGHCDDKCSGNSIQGPWISVKAYYQRIYTIFDDPIIGKN